MAQCGPHDMTLLTASSTYRCRKFIIFETLSSIFGSLCCKKSWKCVSVQSITSTNRYVIAVGLSLRFDYRCVGSARQACLLPRLRLRPRVWINTALDSSWLCRDLLRCLHLQSWRDRSLLPRHLPLRYFDCLGVLLPATNGVRSVHFCKTVFSLAGDGLLRFVQGFY